MKNYHYANGYTHERIVPKTVAYIYMTIDGTTQEYEVINRGDYFRPQISQVYFKDEKKVLRRYLPVYEEGKIAELVYSNTKLQKPYSEVSKFTKKIVDFTSKTLSYTTHHKVFSKAVSHEQKEFEKEKLIPLEEARKCNAKYLNVVVHLADPVGEVEDLYHDMESSFHLTYAQNKGIVDEIRAKNRYAYAVADMLEYLYVDKNEQADLNTNITEMKKQYKVMQDTVLSKLIDTLPSTKTRKIYNKAGAFVKEESYNPKADIKQNISKFVNPTYDFSKSYFDETQFISKSFFPRTPMFQIRMDETLFMYEKDFKNDNNGNPSTAYKIANIKPLKFGEKNFKKLNTMERLSFLIFTLAYHQDFEQERSKFPKFLEASEKFYYLLKTTKPLPSINDKSIKEVQTELDKQSELTTLVQSSEKKGSLFDEFESLETLHKEFSFDADLAKKRNSADKLGFKSLKLGKINKAFYYDKAVLTPKTIAKKIAIKLSAKTTGKGTSVADLLKSYTEISAGLKDQPLLEYYDVGLNLAYMLCAPRAIVDSESDLLSMFNKGHEPLNDFVINLSKGMEKIKDVEEALSLHEKEIKEHYLNAIYTLISHAMMQDDSTRKTNALKLLNFIPIDTKKSKEELSNINDHNYSNDLKIKDEINERYEQLKNLNTISSKIGDLHNNLPKETQASTTTPSIGGQIDESKVLGIQHLENKSKIAYKGLLTSTKGLAFFMTIGSLVEYSQKGNSEKLKLYNFIGAANDLIAVSTAMAEKGAKDLTKGSIKSVSTVVNKLANADSKSLKLIAKLGVIGVLVTSINDINQLDKNDTDGIITTTTKNAIVMVLLLSPGWVAVGGIMAVELAWMFLKDNFVDSVMQVYLRKNLYFNNQEAQSNNSGGSSASMLRILMKNSQPAKSSYLSPIMLETLKEGSGKYTYKTKENQNGLSIEGFDTVKEIRTFIADNYNNNKTAFDTAMTNELATLKQVLYGMKLETDKDASAVIKLNSSTLNNESLLTIMYPFFKTSKLSFLISPSYDTLGSSFTPLASTLFSA